ncbi:MAG: hypothetical protein OXB88_00890, partial [Bacteriovoracales bacterium]|nr:hypothetical protein [Bacteriovoracales bacterium]
MGEGQTILIVKNRGLGDAIITLGACAYMRELFPKARLVLGTPSWVAPLFKGVSTVCDEIFPIELKTLRDGIDLWQKVRALSPDLVHECHQSGRTGKFFKLFSFFHGADYSFYNHHFG